MLSFAGSLRVFMAVEPLAGQRTTQVTERRTRVDWAHFVQMLLMTVYALTLKHWRMRFLANLDAVRRLGYAEEFIRMWEYYLCYCEAGFRERNLGLVQVVLAKPGYR